METDKVAGAERAILGGCDQAKREKRWNECSIEEKIERLRNVLRQVEETTVVTGQIATKAHEVAHDHQHDLAGRVVRLVQDNRNWASDAPMAFGFQRRRQSLLD